MCFFFHVFFSYIDLLDESQTKLSSDLLDSRQSISQIQVIYIIISWVKNVRGELKKILEVFLLVLCTIFCFKLSWLFKCNSSSGLQFSFNMLGILFSFLHKMPHKHLLLSSFWIFFLVAIFVRFIFASLFRNSKSQKCVYDVALKALLLYAIFSRCFSPNFVALLPNKFLPLFRVNRELIINNTAKRQIQVENFSK